MTKQFKITITIITLIIMLLTLINLDSGEVSAEWKYQDFERNVSVSFKPVTPGNMEPVNVTIIDKNQAGLSGGNLWFNFSTVDGSWGSVFKPVSGNPSAYFAEIPGYPGGTFVQFYVDAWDNQNKVIRSPTYSYTIEKSNAWEFSEFDDNIDLIFGPHEPKQNENVTITLESINSDVPISNAFVNFTFQLPEATLPSRNYTQPAFPLSTTEWESTIQPYSNGTRITFWAVVLDEYNTKLISRPYTYVVKQVDPGVIIFQSSLKIRVVDTTGLAISDVVVNVRNSSWSENFELDETGVVETPILSSDVDPYIVTVTYLDYVKEDSITIPNPDNDYTASFIIDKAKLFSERHGVESFPKWFVTAAFVFILIFLPLLLYSQYEHRREIVSKRKTDKIYKHVETPTAEKPWEPLLVPFKPILKLLEDEQRRIGISQFIAFFVLGLLGASWAPFYPWWLIIIIGFAIGSVSYKFPYLALIVTVIFVLAATAYQAPEFGFVFMFFSIVILICAFFNWKFGFLVLLAVFLSRLGVMIFVPITATLLYSLFLGLAVLIVSGLFMTFFVTLGNFTNLSFLIGPPHQSAFIIFNKQAPAEFLPVQFVDAIGSLREPNLDLINSIFRDNYSTMVPIVQIVIWALLIYMVYFITEKYSEKNLLQYISFVTIPMAVFPITSISAIVFFDFALTPGVMALAIALIGIGLTAVLTSFTIKDFFPSLFKKEIERDIIGTRISQLMSLRRSSFKNVGGLDEIKRELKTSITIPLLRPKLSRLYGVNPPKGVMLFGPPGCGKTLLMRGLATELNVEMIGVKCSDIMSKWYGESEEMTARMFKIARNRAPCILFLDEIDAVAKRRSFYSTDDVTPRLLSIMLNELDGMDESAGIMVVGATNMPEIIDPALLRPGRFDKIIYVPPPGFEARKEIFKIYLKNKPLAHGVNYYQLAGRTEGFSGADIENIVKEVSMSAMRRTLETHRRAMITMNDFDEVLREIKPSVSKKMQKEFEKLGFDYSRRVEGKKKKKTRKANKKKGRDEDDIEDIPSEPISVGEGDISWVADEEEERGEEKEDEEEDVEPQSWDRYVPKRKPARKDKRIRFETVDEEDHDEEEDGGHDEDEFEFEPGQEDDDTDEKSDSEEGPYKTVWQSEEDEEDEYWM